MNKSKIGTCVIQAPIVDCLFLFVESYFTSSTTVAENVFT